MTTWRKCIEFAARGRAMASIVIAITAAVVGVILNLALFFAYHVLWPQGFAGRFDWPSALIALAAAIALLRYKMNVIPVIAGCALLGLAIH